jgi:hypothetical protein
MFDNDRYRAIQGGRVIDRGDCYGELVDRCLRRSSDPEIRIDGGGRTVARIFDGQVIEVKVAR